MGRTKPQVSREQSPKKEQARKRLTISLPDKIYSAVKANAHKNKSSVNDVLLDALRHWTDAEALAAKNEVARKIRGLWGVLDRGFSNSYQSLVVNWRVERTVLQVKEVERLRLTLEAHPANVYLIRVIE